MPRRQRPRRPRERHDERRSQSPRLAPEPGGAAQPDERSADRRHDHRPQSARRGCRAAVGAHRLSTDGGGAAASVRGRWPTGSVGVGRLVYALTAGSDTDWLAVRVIVTPVVGVAALTAVAGPSARSGRRTRHGVQAAHQEHAHARCAVQDINSKNEGQRRHRGRPGERPVADQGCPWRGASVLADDHSSGPPAQTTAVRHHEASYSRQRRGRVTAWNFSRFPRNRPQAAEDPELLHGC